VVQFPAREKDFLFPKAFKPGLKPSQTLIGYSEVFPPGQGGRGVKLTTHLYLMQSEDVPPPSPNAFMACTRIVLSLSP
jgi:hypothetical protein